jgi:hypothetical protein
LKERYPRGKSKAISKRYEKIISKERPELIKANYKKVKERFKKANDFYEDETIPVEKKEKFYPEFEEVLVDAEAYRRAYEQVMLDENQIKMI